MCRYFYQGYAPSDSLKALDELEKIRSLIISYSGYILQEPRCFPSRLGMSHYRYAGELLNLFRRNLGAAELVQPLLSLSALSAPLLSSSNNSQTTLAPSDVEQFLQDFARRFEPDNEIDDILAPVVRGLLFHESLFRRKVWAEVIQAGAVSSVGWKYLCRLRASRQ